MAFRDYKIGDDGAYHFELDDGSTLRTAPTPGAALEAARIDRGRQMLADAGGSSGGPNASEGPSMSGYDPGAGGASGAPPGPAPSMSDAGPGYSAPPVPPAPLASEAPPQEAGAGGAPPWYQAKIAESSGLRPGLPEPVAGGGGAVGASGDAAKQAAAASGDPRPVAPGAAAPGAAGKAGAPGSLDPSKVKYGGPAPAAGGRGGGGGGGGAAPGPKEMLAGRQVTIEGKLSPETKAAQEAVIRRDAALKKREVVRGDERAEYDRENEDRAAAIGARHDEHIREVREAGQKTLDDLATRRADKLKEIEDGKIDPKKFWADRGTGHSIAAD